MADTRTWCRYVGPRESGGPNVLCGLSAKPDSRWCSGCAGILESLPSDMRAGAIALADAYETCEHRNVPVELADARKAVGLAWTKPADSLAEAITMKTRMLERAAPGHAAVVALVEAMLSANRDDLLDRYRDLAHAVVAATQDCAPDHDFWSGEVQCPWCVAPEDLLP